MLRAEVITSNWANFLKLIEKYISSPRKEKLLEFYKKYEERFILMPASHKVQYHNCFPGGYIDHVLRVTEGALKIHNVWFEMGVNVNYTIEELVFSAINHDLGKFGDEQNESYIPQTDQWRREKLNETYEFNNKLEFMTVPDRGLFLLRENGINYSRNEFLAIKLHDGMYDDSNKPYLMGWLPEQKPRTSLVYILHHADMMASRIEFEKEWLPKFQEEKPKVVQETSKPSKVPSINSKKMNSIFDKLKA